MPIAKLRRLLFPLVSAALLVACAPTSELEDDDEEAEEADDALKEVVTFDVITHNIAGGMLNYGQPKALETVEAAIANAKPDAVMLQEVCSTQAAQFAANHPAWAVEFRVTRPEHPNCGPLGHLIAVGRSKVGVAEQLPRETAFGRDVVERAMDRAAVGETWKQEVSGAPLDEERHVLRWRYFSRIYLEPPRENLVHHLPPFPQFPIHALLAGGCGP